MVTKPPAPRRNERSPVKRKKKGQEVKVSPLWWCERRRAVMALQGPLFVLRWRRTCKKTCDWTRWVARAERFRALPARCAYFLLRRNNPHRQFCTGRKKLPISWMFFYAYNWFGFPPFSMCQQQYPTNKETEVFLIHVSQTCLYVEAGACQKKKIWWMKIVKKNQTHKWVDIMGYNKVSALWGDKSKITRPSWDYEIPRENES